MKECIASNYKECKVVEFRLKMATDKTLYLQYPSLSKLVEIVLLFSASTSEVKQGYKYLNSLKTKFRNRLGAVHLDQPLRLRLNCTDTSNCPFHLAYTHWLESKCHCYIIQRPVEKIDIEDSDSDDSY